MLFAILLVLLALLVLYLLALRGRGGIPALGRLQGWRYAHRGLHQKPQVPENSLAAFRRAVAQGYGAEFDVHLLADGELAVIHDSKLERTTGQPGEVEDLTAADLLQYRLEGTEQTIPTFGQVLEVFCGKTPLIIELKTARGNAAALCEAVCRQLEGYAGTYCIESFDPRCLVWLRKNRPEIIRGQLSCNFFKENAGLSAALCLLMTFLLGNFAAKPDFIAYQYSDRRNLSNRLCLRLWGLQGVSWTLRTPAELEQAEAEGLLPIFEQFEPGAKQP